MPNLELNLGSNPLHMRVGETVPLRLEIRRIPQ